MDAEKLVAFTNLKDLLTANFEDLNANEVATLIVANFEVKQIFQTSKPLREGISKGRTNQPPTTSQPEGQVGATKPMSKRKPQTDEEFDEQHKQKQMKDAKSKLKQMREEAYESALKSQFGMESEETDMSIFEADFSEEENPIVRADKMKVQAKQEESLRRMESGEGKVMRSS
jgi:hypothetical protein